MNCSLYGRASLGSEGKDHLQCREIEVWSRIQEDVLEKGISSHSCLRIPWKKRPGKATQSMGGKVVQLWAIITFTFTFTYCLCWSKLKEHSLHSRFAEELTENIGRVIFLVDLDILANWPWKWVFCGKLASVRIRIPLFTGPCFILLVWYGDIAICSLVGKKRKFNNFSHPLIPITYNLKFNLLPILWMCV